MKIRCYSFEHCFHQTVALPTVWKVCRKTKHQYCSRQGRSNFLCRLFFPCAYISSPLLLIIPFPTSLRNSHAHLIPPPILLHPQLPRTAKVVKHKRQYAIRMSNSITCAGNRIIHLRRRSPWLGLCRFVSSTICSWPLASRRNWSRSSVRFVTLLPLCRLWSSKFNIQINRPAGYGFRVSQTNLILNSAPGITAGRHLLRVGRKKTLVYNWKSAIHTLARLWPGCEW